MALVTPQPLKTEVELYDSASVRSQTALVVFNPTAGNRGRLLVNAVVGELRVLGWHVSLVETRQTGHAKQIASSLNEGTYNEPDVLVVAGGDGTINEIINGLAVIGRLDLPVGLIPIGTVNLLASEIKLPRSPQLLAQIISDGHFRNVVLGQICTMCKRHFFLMTAGVGYDARSVLRVSHRLKRLNGKLAYIVAGIEEYLLGRWPCYQVVIDGEEVVTRSILFANGRCYAGRMIWAPAANIELPTLEVGFFARAGRFRLPLYALALTAGRLYQMRDVSIRRATEVHLVGPPSEPIQADGDIVAYLPVSVSVASVGARILVPS